ncbi:MAG: hypothetical protein U0930_01175 [Pirellulales bacterium]
MLKMLLTSTVLSITFISGVVAQTIREDIDRETLELAEDCAVGLMALKTDLPSRWAALQRRIVTNTGEISALKVVQRRVDEIWAYDSKSNVTYTRGLFNTESMEVTESSEAFPMIYATYTVPNRILEKVESSGEWTEVKRKSQIGYSSTYPLGWSVGLYNSSLTGSLGMLDYLEGLFVEKGRKCLYAKRINNNLLTGIWGSLRAPAPYALKVTFDIKSRVPLEYSLIQFNGAITQDAIRDGKFVDVEKGQVEWREFKLSPKIVGKTKNGNQTINLPVRVKLLSVMNKGEEIELVNELYWKFGTEVPDSTFVDPTKAELIEPKFEIEPLKR